MKNKLHTLFCVIFTLSSYLGYAQSSLIHSEGWTTQNLTPGLLRHTFSGYNPALSSYQNVNVLEFDLRQNEYKLEFKSQRDSLSAVASTVPNAVAGINGTYMETITENNIKYTTSFFRCNGITYHKADIPLDNLYGWKHEGAFYYAHTPLHFSIDYGTSASYISSPVANIISGAPILIHNFDPTGERFVDTTIDITNLPAEDKNKHQGIRHPRTAIGYTANDKMLMITVDGRHSQAAGMTAKELTQFMRYYFDPKSLLNIDGGGSTTLWIANSNESTTGVVNYPCDNKKYDHYGQRTVTSFLILTRNITNNETKNRNTSDHTLDIQNGILTLSAQETISSVKITDNSGRTLSENRPNSFSFQYSLLQKGIYYIEFSIGNHTYTQSVFI